MFDYRFRDVHRYALARDHVSGFSTLEQGMVDERYLEYQAVLIPNGHGIHQIVSAQALGDPRFENIEEMFRAAHRYAVSQNFATGFPAFEQGFNQNNQLMFDTTLLSSSIVDVRSVPADDLGTPSFANTVSMFISVHRYAMNLNAGYISGFPIFEQGLRDGVLHYGVALIKATAFFMLIPADVLAVYGGAALSSIVEFGVVIFNNSPKPVYVKDEQDTEKLRTIAPNSWGFGRFDGIAASNQEKGRIAKCPDWNIGYVDRNGRVRCFGPRGDAPYVGIEPDWRPNSDSLGDNWKDLDNAAKEFDPPPAGGGGGDSQHERHDHDWDPPDQGGIIHDAPSRDREEASRTV